MQGFNLIAVLDESGEKILMCRRSKAPYQGLYNFVGGKINAGEEGFTAAYRELEEETQIHKTQITLTHLMDLYYYLPDFYMEVYVGRLQHCTEVKGSENALFWMDMQQDFFDAGRFAGNGNLGHIMHYIHLWKAQSEQKL